MEYFKKNLALVVGIFFWPFLTIIGIFLEFFIQMEIETFLEVILEKSCSRILRLLQEYFGNIFLNNTKNNPIIFLEYYMSIS